MSDTHRHADEPDAPRWRVLWVGPDGIQPVEVSPGTELSLGAGTRIRAGADGTLEFDAGSGGGLALLNDVQLSGSSALRAGDQVRMGESVALVQGVTEPPVRRTRHPWSAEHFALRLAEELAATGARGQGGALFLVQVSDGDRDVRAGVIEGLGSPEESAGVVIGELGSDSLQLWVDAREVAKVRALVEELQAEGMVVRFGMSAFPEDALVREGLVNRALRRMWSTEGAPELLVQDPMMVRLQGLMERVAAEDGPVLLVGEAGVGKTRWAFQIHQRSGRRMAPFTRVRCRRTDAERLAAVLSEVGGGRGTILFDKLETLDPATQRVLVDAWPSDARVIATIEASGLVEQHGASLLPELSERLGRITLTIPALRDRPSEVVPLAMQALQQARAALGRSRATLTAEARRALQEYRWPGNLRELRNAVRLAALVAESDEVRLENLPALVQRGLSAELESGADLRTALKATEKDALLKVLARTRWNVTAAARELGLPRRTVVYRMSRLGLKRPAH